MYELKTTDFEKLDICQLKKEGLLTGANNTTVTFNDGTTAELYIYISPIHGYIYITMDDKVEEDKREIHIRLDVSKCNYGNFRYWYVCPGTLKSACGKRVRTLYKMDNELACKECHDLIYPSKIRGKDSVFNVAHKEVCLLRKLENIKPSLKRFTYNKKPTKRYLRFKKLISEYEKAKEETNRRFGDYKMHLYGGLDVS